MDVWSEDMKRICQWLFINMNETFSICREMMLGFFKVSDCSFREYVTLRGHHWRLPRLQRPRWVHLHSNCLWTEGVSCKLHVVWPTFVFGLVFFKRERSLIILLACQADLKAETGKKTRTARTPNSIKKQEMYEQDVMWLPMRCLTFVAFPTTSLLRRQIQTRTFFCTFAHYAACRYGWTCLCGFRPTNRRKLLVTLTRAFRKVRPQIGRASTTEVVFLWQMFEDHPQLGRQKQHLKHPERCEGLRWGTQHVDTARVLTEMRGFHCAKFSFAKMNLSENRKKEAVTCQDVSIPVLVGVFVSCCLSNHLAEAATSVYSSWNLDCVWLSSNLESLKVVTLNDRSLSILSFCHVLAMCMVLLFPWCSIGFFHPPAWGMPGWKAILLPRHVEFELVRACEKPDVGKAWQKYSCQFLGSELEEMALLVETVMCLLGSGLGFGFALAKHLLLEFAEASWLSVLRTAIQAALFWSKVSAWEALCLVFERPATLAIISCRHQSLATLIILSDFVTCFGLHDQTSLCDFSPDSQAIHLIPKDPKLE